MFRTLWRYRELILSLVKRELKTKYKSSALGFFWSLCKPLFIILILFVVFVVIVPIRFENAYFFTPSTPLIEPADLTDVTALADRLSAGKDPLAAHLRASMTDEGRATLSSNEANAEPPEWTLTREMNYWLASGESLYDAEAFNDVTLRDSTRETLEGAQEDATSTETRILLLNRALLEDAFPENMIRNRAERATRRAFGVHLMIGILLWYYFAGSLGESTQSILANGNLIKKVKVPAEVFPVATVLANLVHLLLAIVVLIPVILLLGYKITWLALTLPVLIALMTVMIAGFAFLLSSTNVFYRDVSSITEIVLMAWFYITPIFYPFSVAWHTLQEYPRVFTWLFIGNPMATVCIVARRVLFVGDNFPRLEMDDSSILKYLVLCLIISALIYGVGRLVFLRLSPRFADEV